MSLPVAVVIQQLQEPDSVVPILKSLYTNLNALCHSKAEANHLVSRTLNLMSAHLAYKKWCGVVITEVLVKNYEILSGSGLKFVNALLKILETANQSTDIKLFNATVRCLNKVCDEIRGKPTLTREILTPKLPVIIQLYLNTLDLNPELIIESLYNLMSHHPTTFRPFANKLNSRLVEYLKLDFSSFPSTLKFHISRTYALLPIIEKTDADKVWSNKLNGVINEIVDILSIFKDLIDFSQDSELLSLISNPVFKVIDDARIFPFLQIDISKPETLLQLSTRLETLFSLLVGFISTSLGMCVKFPLGKVISLMEIIFSINTHYLPVKRDIRDEKAKALTRSITIKIQESSLPILNALTTTFQGPMIIYLTNILLVLETSIPMNKKAVDSEEVLNNEQFTTKLLSTVSKILQLVQLYQEPQQLVRFVEAALILVEPRINVNGSSSSNIDKANNTKKTKKKNSQAIPMADLLSHSHLFDGEIPAETIDTVRTFVNSVITRTELPSTQHYKIMRYLIIEAVKSTHFSYNNSMSSELKRLLINAVTYPGFEKVSLLPIVSSIMGDDPLISVFNNPRFPPVPQLIDKSVESDSEEEEEEEETTVLPETNVLSDILNKRTFEYANDTVDTDGKRLKTEQKVPQIHLQDQSESISSLKYQPQDVLKFKESDTPKVAAKSPHQVSNETNTSKHIPVTQMSLTPSHASTDAGEASGDESDFEMPQIDIDGDSDQE